MTIYVRARFLHREVCIIIALPFGYAWTCVQYHQRHKAYISIGCKCDHISQQYSATFIPFAFFVANVHAGLTIRLSIAPMPIGCNNMRGYVIWRLVSVSCGCLAIPPYYISQLCSLVHVTYNVVDAILLQCVRAVIYQRCYFILSAIGFEVFSCPSM